MEKDYIKIAYAGQDVLYVPATSLDLVSKYIGPGEDNERTKLNKLGGTEWAKTTRKAKAAAKDLAEGLIPAVCPAPAAGRPCLLAGQPLAAGV